MVTLTSAEQALKTVYLDVVANQLNTEINPFLARIKQTTQDVWGKEVRKLAPYGINGGIGAGTETGDLPAANSNRYVQFVSTLKNLYGQIELSDKAIRASSDSSGAFVNLLNAEMEGLIKASSFNLGRMLYGDGTGVIATVGAAGTDGVVTVDSVRNVVEGMVVDVYPASSSTAAKTKVRIDAVDRDNKKITLSDNTLDTSVGQRICVQGSLGNELTGLGAIFNTTGTLYGVDKSTYKWMQPYVKDLNGALTEVAIQAAIDRLEEINGSKVDFIVCSAGVKRAFQQMMATYKRSIDMTDLAGGYKAMTYNGIPLIADRFVPEKTMYLLNSKSFHLHQLCDWKWLENENGKILRQTQNKPTYTATLVKYAELICDQPSGQAKIYGITEA